MRKNKLPIIICLIIYIIILLIGVIILLPQVQIQLSNLLYFNTSIILPTFFTLLLCLILLTSMLVYYLLKDKNKNKSELDSTNFYSGNAISGKQEYLEREIAKLNKRLVASEDKWLTAYHLLLSSQNKQANLNGAVSTSRFLKGFGIDADNITIKSNIAFILTPFHPDFAETYVDIREVCSKLKIKAVRSDEEYVKTDLLKHIIKCIVEARVIIVNVDSQNPNVFYELGIAHALNKPTILISKVDSSVPFDVQGQYIVLYKSRSELRKLLHEALLKMLTSNSDY